jgi:DNA (cytosine-5)-methyltransferase 1
VKKIKTVDLFAGCGGLTDGFLQTGHYDEVAAVEWLLPPVLTLKKRLNDKWGYDHAEQSVLHFDIQREDELFGGWNNDPEFGSNKGLDSFVNSAGGIDLIIGGPPCQAYSIAGRVRDENGMRLDYRNYLFEHYLSIVNRYKPKVFIFENVPGILSAAPDGTPITKLIIEGFDKIGYYVSADLEKVAKVNAADYGVPQNRQRIIIIGIRKNIDGDCSELALKFYTEIFPKYKVDAVSTVGEAIGDLPACSAHWDSKTHKKRKSHETPVCNISWHIPRYSNLRDMDTFRTLALDVQSGERKFDSKRIAKLYEEKIGSKSPIHRYHVLEPDLPSTTIIAHLYKDGNRFIHYDPEQSRTITVREAARLQSFDDDFNFQGARCDAYKMVGNAVPPKLAKAIGVAVNELFTIINGGK